VIFVSVECGWIFPCARRRLGSFIEYPFLVRRATVWVEVSFAGVDEDGVAGGSQGSVVGKEAT
jgi:hypothetical protein